MCVRTHVHTRKHDVDLQIAPATIGPRLGNKQYKQVCTYLDCDTIFIILALYAVTVDLTMKEVL